MNSLPSNKRKCVDVVTGSDGGPEMASVPKRIRTEAELMAMLYKLHFEDKIRMAKLLLISAADEMDQDVRDVPAIVKIYTFDDLAQNVSRSVIKYLPLIGRWACERVSTKVGLNCKSLWAVQKTISAEEMDSSAYQKSVLRCPKLKMVEDLYFNGPGYLTVYDVKKLASRCAEIEVFDADPRYLVMYLEELKQNNKVNWIRLDLGLTLVQLKVLVQYLIHLELIDCYDWSRKFSNEKKNSELRQLYCSLGRKAKSFQVCLDTQDFNATYSRFYAIFKPGPNLEILSDGFGYPFCFPNTVGLINTFIQRHPKFKRCRGPVLDADVNEYKTKTVVSIFTCLNRLKFLEHAKINLYFPEAPAYEAFRTFLLSHNHLKSLDVKIQGDFHRLVTAITELRPDLECLVLHIIDWEGQDSRVFRQVLRMLHKMTGLKNFSFVVRTNILSPVPVGFKTISNLLIPILDKNLKLRSLNFVFRGIEKGTFSAKRRFSLLAQKYLEQKRKIIFSSQYWGDKMYNLIK